MMSGPANVAVADASRPVTMAALSEAGVYVLRLSALDTNGNSIPSDDVTITVKPNPVQIGAGSRPLDHLRRINRPAFKEGHSLLPLTYSSCAIDPGIQLELVRHWGYGAQFSTSTELATDPVVRQVKDRPGRFPVAISIASLYPIFDNYNGARSDLPRLPASTWIRDAAGNIIGRGGRPIVSPLAPDSAMDQVGALLGTQAREIDDAVEQPIHLIINAGEYGLFLPADNDPEQLWGQDPRVL